MAMKKAERLLNLIALLLDARRPVPATRIRDALYAEESEQAFRRKFERDKEELRDLGIPVELAADAWGVDEGYAIPKDEALLADPGLTPDEQAALSLAAQAWEATGRAGPATALVKLSVASGVREGDGGAWIVPRVDAGPNLDALLDAMWRRKRVTFAYRTGGAGEAAARTVDPYALRYRGAWYLAGFDHDRGEVRNFKLARIEGAVRVAGGGDPDFARPDHAAVELPPPPWEGEPETTAVVAFAPEAAWWAERHTPARRVGEREDGWLELEVPVRDREAFLAWVLGFADDAELVSPDDLRTAARSSLASLAGA